MFSTPPPAVDCVQRQVTISWRHLAFADPYHVDLAYLLRQNESYAYGYNTVTPPAGGERRHGASFDAADDGTDLGTYLHVHFPKPRGGETVLVGHVRTLLGSLHGRARLDQAFQVASDTAFLRVTSRLQDEVAAAAEDVSRTEILGGGHLKRTARSKRARHEANQNLEAAQARLDALEAIRRESPVLSGECFLQPSLLYQRTIGAYPLPSAEDTVWGHRTDSVPTPATLDPGLVARLGLDARFASPAWSVGSSFAAQPPGAVDGERQADRGADADADLREADAGGSEQEETVTLLEVERDLCRLWSASLPAVGCAPCRAVFANIDDRPASRQTDRRRQQGESRAETNARLARAARVAKTKKGASFLSAI